MKIILTGATGMIGTGVLLECIDDPTITEILIIGRSPIQLSHPKVKEILCDDWTNLSKTLSQASIYDACFFCLGATFAVLSEAKFRYVTYTLTTTFSEQLAVINPNITFCYITGMGVDGSKQQSLMPLKIKGETEQFLLNLPFNHVYIFRPGYIQPMRGARPRTLSYLIFYSLLKPLYPVLSALIPKAVTSTVQIGKAMISVAKTPYTTSFLENMDINYLAQKK